MLAERRSADGCSVGANRQHCVDTAPILIVRMSRPFRRGLLNAYLAPSPPMVCESGAAMTVSLGNFLSGGELRWALRGRIAWAAILLLLASSCGPRGIGARIQSPERGMVAPGHGIVFGRVVFDGQVSSAFSYNILRYLFVLPANARAVSEAPINADGSFCWELPPGPATITSYVTASHKDRGLYTVGGSGSGTVGGRFIVREAAVAYIGNLHIGGAREPWVSDETPLVNGACDAALGAGYVRSLMDIRRR